MMRWLRGLWRRWQGRCPRCGSITFVHAKIQRQNGKLVGLAMQHCGERCGWEHVDARIAL